MRSNSMKPRGAIARSLSMLVGDHPLAQRPAQRERRPDSAGMTRIVQHLGEARLALGEFEAAVRDARVAAAG